MPVSFRHPTKQIEETQFLEKDAMKDSNVGFFIFLDLFLHLFAKANQFLYFWVRLLQKIQQDKRTCDEFRIANLSTLHSTQKTKLINYLNKERN